MAAGTRDAPAVRCVAAVRNRLGEGVMWAAEQGCLYWVDVVPPSTLYRLTPATGPDGRDTVEQWAMPEMITALAARADGSLLVCSHGGVNIVEPGKGPEVSFRRVATPDALRPFNRSNDGAPDARGRFWIGTMQNNIAPDGTDLPVIADEGTLWRIDPDFSAHAMVTGLRIPNSTAFSPDGCTLYLSDTPKQVIWAFDLDLDAGTLSNRRVFSDRTDLGYPDGSCVDAEGFLWNARWAAGCVARFAPDGRLDRTVPIPADNVTCPAFGGEDLSTLYVTTSRAHATAESLARFPETGGLFALEPGETGLRRPLFGG